MNFIVFLLLISSLEHDFRTVPAGCIQPLLTRRTSDSEIDSISFGDICQSNSRSRAEPVFPDLVKWRAVGGAGDLIRALPGAIHFEDAAEMQDVFHAVGVSAYLVDEHGRISTPFSPNGGPVIGNTRCLVTA